MSSSWSATTSTRDRDSPVTGSGRRSGDIPFAYHEPARPTAQLSRASTPTADRGDGWGTQLGRAGTPVCRHPVRLPRTGAPDPSALADVDPYPGPRRRLRRRVDPADHVVEPLLG